jgi:transposase
VGGARTAVSYREGDWSADDGDAVDGGGDRLAVPDRAPWRDVPDRFGYWNSIYQRFSDWSRDGTWARVLATVQTSSAAAGEVDWSVSVDSTITRVHQLGGTLPRDTGGRIELQEARGSGAA